MLVANKAFYNKITKLKSTNYLFDYLMVIIISIYVIKEKILTVSLNINKEYLPIGEQRIELLTGEKIIRNKFFNEGAYSLNLDEYFLGPIPYNYPSAIGWFLYGKGPFENISNYYITANILYFSALMTLLLSIIVIFKNFNKLYGYLFTFLILASYNIGEGANYFYQIPNTINPGSVSIYSIAVSALFISSLKNDKLIYIYLLVFFSGILLQNHMTSIFYASTILFYSIVVLFKSKNEKKNYLLIFFASIPWIQIAINILEIVMRFNSKKDNIEVNAFIMPLFEKYIYQILPFNNIFNISQFNEGKITYFIYLSIYLIPIITYFIIKEEIKLKNYKMKLFSLVTIITTFDIILINYKAHESQHRNYIVGQIFIFILFFITFIIKKINKKVIKVVLIILFINLLINNNSAGINQINNNKYLTKENIQKLKSKPVILESYDSYNANRSIFLELVYELIVNRIDFCIKSVDKNINYNYEFSDLGNYHKSLNYISDYICNEKQLLDDRTNLYLVEDKAESLPLYFNNAYMITRLSNNNIHQREQMNKNNKVKNDCPVKIKDKSSYNNVCEILKISLESTPYISNALYFQKDNIEKNLMKKIYDKKNIINNSILTNEEIFNIPRNCNNCIINIININKQDKIVTEFKEYLDYYHDYILSIDNELIKINDLIEKNLDIVKNDFIDISYNNKLTNNVNNVNKNNIIGEYMLSYKNKVNNENVILVKELEKKKYLTIKNENFTCKYKVYYIDNKIKIDTPLCNLQNDLKFNKKMADNINKTELTKEIYQILYKDLNIENRNNILENITKPAYNSTGLIKSIEIVEMQSKPTLRNDLFNHFTPYNENYKQEFISKNNLISITAKVNYQKEINSTITNQCLVEIFQPWYYMIPKYHYIEIHSCN